MKGIQRYAWLGRSLRFVCAVAALAAVATAPAGAQIDVARGKPANESSRNATFARGSTPALDAEGAVDGHTPDGSWHFHTELQPTSQNPGQAWWQVDLQGTFTLSEVRVYNRMDGDPQTAYTVQVLLSNDGNTWTKAYDNNGKVFGGVRGADQSKWDPLRVTDAVNGKQTRFVRLQLASPSSTYLHLDAVQVYGTQGGSGTTPPPGTGQVTVRTRQPSYTTSENITVDATGLPGNKQGWFGVAPVGSADDQASFVNGVAYWDYASGNGSDSRTFPPLPAGNYEGRAWVLGKLQTRYPFTVTAASAATGAFDGIWETGVTIQGSSIGDYRLYLGLVQSGSQVTGYYWYPGDAKWYLCLSGTISGNVLQGNWATDNAWFSGPYTFTLSNNATFSAKNTLADGVTEYDFTGYFLEPWAR